MSYYPVVHSLLLVYLLYQKKRLFNSIEHDMGVNFPLEMCTYIGQCYLDPNSSTNNILPIALRSLFFLDLRYRYWLSQSFIFKSRCISTILLFFCYINSAKDTFHIVKQFCNYYCLNMMTRLKARSLRLNIFMISSSVDSPRRYQSYQQSHTFINNQGEAGNHNIL